MKKLLCFTLSAVLAAALAVPALVPLEEYLAAVIT